MQFITFHQTIFCFYLVIKAKKFNFAPKNTYNDEEYIIYISICCRHDKCSLCMWRQGFEHKGRECACRLDGI